MMLCIHSDLYVIADDARAAPARRHRTRIRVGQGNLPIGRRSIFARVKFLSRLLTALNLLPSMATLAFVRRPISRQTATNCAHTLRIAGPLSLRKSAIVL